MEQVKKSIMVTWDFSSVSYNALKHAIRMSRIVKYNIILFHIVKLIQGLFKPKFLRIADNLEQAIVRKKHISHKLDISQKREHLTAKMEHIWMKAEMQYPLSELDFEKLGGS